MTAAAVIMAGPAARGPGPQSGPTRAALLLRCAPSQSAVCAPACLRPAFCPLRVRCCAGAPAPARVRFGAARPRAVAPPSPRPPGSPARPVCAAVRLRGRSLGPLRFALPSLRCGLPVVALAALRRGFALRVPAPGPPGASRCFGGFPRRCAPRRAAPARGPARACGPLGGGLSAPGPFGCARGLPRLLRFSGFCVPRCLGSQARPGAPCCVLPCAPRPPPPLGAPGARGPLGLRPALGRASRAPVACPRRAARAARCRIPAAVVSPKIVNRVLTEARKRGIFEVRGPFRSLGSRRKVSVDGIKAPLGL